MDIDVVSSFYERPSALTSSRYPTLTTSCHMNATFVGVSNQLDIYVNIFLTLF